MSLDTLTQKVRSMAEGTNLGHTVKFAIKEGGVIFVDATRQPPLVTNDDAEADTTVKVSSANLEKLMDGDLNPAAALMMGKIRIEGNMGVAMKLASMLG